MIYIPDSPYYSVTGKRVWDDNVERLIEVKEEYDPECRIHVGRVCEKSLLGEIDIVEYINVFHEFNVDDILLIHN